MAKLPSPVLSVSLTLAFASLLSACDRQSTEPAQQKEETVKDLPDGTSGTVSRNHAGEPLPDITVSDPSGTTLDLTALKGKPTLINLWATWCAPCIVEMPQLNTIAGERKDHLRVLTISQDLQGAEKVVPFFEQKKFTNLPRWMDPENDLIFAYQGGELPLTILYNAKGEEIWRVTGGFDWSGEKATRLIDEAIEPQPAASSAT
ncbi:TlpA family protein disulfide reductase [Altericroceibacterium spongiae]|uniref:TlpA family protein disulfide reductase n=1 Tax=Altericroceibacterium spongiae TaxID=2320269 RepID=UPI001EE50580|nr:TlpA disulfide reductase family protein [Altericroceibacterium spongiae]